MYRRIELISHLPIDVEGVYRKMLDIKGGICSPQHYEVIEVWHDMPIPRKRIWKNCRFYFTERGWKVYGRAIVKACQKVGQEYRVICIKENSVDAFYKDEIQVVVRPLKKTHKKTL
jgi:hypothetical protein